MLRLLILALLVVIVWLVIEAMLRRLRATLGEAARRAQQNARGDTPAGAAPQTLDRLVSCAACGVRVPERRALIAPGGAGGVYCSEACRAAGAHRTAVS
jgi:hypothetical protein